MQTRFILGPAGSGKTYGCLAEIRCALADQADDQPLFFVTPKQNTYQLEHQLLSDSALRGYTRLRIVSFERLAAYIFSALNLPAPRLLDEAGRLMVLRSLLARPREGVERLKLFHASSRLNGFAHHLSLVLRELQRQRLTPDDLAGMSRQFEDATGLGLKLHDLSILLREYLGWLETQGLQDADRLLFHAAESLKAAPAGINFGTLWLDGFLDYSPSELELLAQLIPRTYSATLTFCLPQPPSRNLEPFSQWNPAQKTYTECHALLAALPGRQFIVQTLSRFPGKNRFSSNPVLNRLASEWEKAQLTHVALAPLANDDLTAALRLVMCRNPESEAIAAAREIRRFVKNGGRYSEISVLTRDLDRYHETFRNVFARYDIPLFLDRRESMAHHPVAELTRNALRTIALGWDQDDWFAALKTGLAPAKDAEIDWLENEAMANGWQRQAWLDEFVIPGNPGKTIEIEALRKRLVTPFEKLRNAIGIEPDSNILAASLRQFWKTLKVGEALEQWSRHDQHPEPIHLTIWEQMHQWLDNLELAFSTTRMFLREWLPILEAGLGGLSVGAIPPVLDQVLIGAIDRSRNPEIKLAIVTGLNETVFPAPPRDSALLTEADRRELFQHGYHLLDNRSQINREQFFGYVAITRAHQRLVLTSSQSDAQGKPLNPSPFVSRIKTIFPSLVEEKFVAEPDWHRIEHPHELIVPFLKNAVKPAPQRDPTLEQFRELPIIQQIHDRFSHSSESDTQDHLDAQLAAQLYGPVLKTSISRMEQFANCPFKFFVHSGLRAQERRAYELDVRERGNFQHEVLAQFNRELRSENKRWRDISPTEAQTRIVSIAASMTTQYQQGLLAANEEGRFAARMLTNALKDFIGVLVEWMHSQYQFDPVAVELPFDGKTEGFPPWLLPLDSGKSLALSGRIDRIDLYKNGDDDSALCVVIDYKSSYKKLQALQMDNGLQLQLPAYLNVLRHWKNARETFGVSRLIPAGVFYVSLRQASPSKSNRVDALAEITEQRKEAYRHRGRFDQQHVGLLDRRRQSRGDQFSYSLNRDGSLSKRASDALASEEFSALLDQVEQLLKSFANQIYAGVVEPDPWRKGKATACQQCDYQSICRLDSWAHNFRTLKPATAVEAHE